MAAIVALKIPICPSAVFLKFPCPGCGMTRATLALLHGDFAHAFHLHPLAIVITPLFGLYASAHTVSYIRHGQSRVDESLTGKWVDRSLLLIMILMIALWVSRFFGAFGGPIPV